MVFFFNFIFVHDSIATCNILDIMYISDSESLCGNVLKMLAVSFIKFHLLFMKWIKNCGYLMIGRSTMKVGIVLWRKPDVYCQSCFYRYLVLENRHMCSYTCDLCRKICELQVNKRNGRIQQNYGSINFKN